MKYWLVWLALTAGSVCTGAAAEPYSLPDGTLLGLENASSVVERVTRGEIGHVALAFRDGPNLWIYEATPAKVRRIAAEEYFQELARLNASRDENKRTRAWALTPASAYSAEETAKMRAYLDAQLGRRYSVKNYVRQKPSDGIHCAELASTTLNQSGRYAFEECCKLHPQALYSALLATHASPREIKIPPLQVQEPWYLRTERWWASHFLWCRWSLREAWLWCW